MICRWLPFEYLIQAALGVEIKTYNSKRRLSARLTYRAAKGQASVVYFFCQETFILQLMATKDKDTSFSSTNSGSRAHCLCRSFNFESVVVASFHHAKMRCSKALVYKALKTNFSFPLDTRKKLCNFSNPLKYQYLLESCFASEFKDFTSKNKLLNWILTSKGMQWKPFCSMKTQRKTVLLCSSAFLNVDPAN